MLTLSKILLMDFLKTEGGYCDAEHYGDNPYGPVEKPAHGS
jgi:hypothetical protein